MSVELLLGLGALALIDSTSIGTLVIPIFLMLSPDRSVLGRVLVYLLTVAVFYFAIGVGLMFGLMPALESVGDGEIFRWVELVAGVGLFALSFRFDPKRRAARGAKDRSSWARDKANLVRGSSWGMVLLGVTAAGIEVATMLPYLAAIGLMIGADLSAAAWLPTLGAYNAVMVLPALLLLAARFAAGERMEKVLNRVAAWMSRHSASALSWTLGIIGFLLARDAAVYLFFV
ncbi:GAP family protein [Streptosporangium soli]|nr:GAP family protein [Streptosporangium sp. KLBMP 9127]